MSLPYTNQNWATFNTSSIVNDRGSRADSDASFWVPTAYPAGSKFLGMSATPNYNVPPVPLEPYYLFSADPSAPGAPPFAAPVSFRELWTCSGDGQPSDLGIYLPVAPAGYVGIGFVAVMDFNHPPVVTDFPDLVCVRQDLAVQVSLGANSLVWNDKGSGAPVDVSVWRLPNSGAGAATVADGYPTSVNVWDLVTAP